LDVYSGDVTVDVDLNLYELYIEGGSVTIAEGSTVKVNGYSREGWGNRDVWINSLSDIKQDYYGIVQPDSGMYTLAMERH
jgi:uncharacterized protein YjhX (UPF0386 family)